MKTATPATARAINDRLALDLLIERGPLTAPQLRELTGLSRPTVADLVERLGTAGLVESVGEAEETRRGPNARLYRLIAERAHVVGVDLRRTGFTATVADLTGATVGTATRRFDATDTADAADTAAAADATDAADAADAPAIAPPANGPRRAPDLIASLAEAITQAANGRQPHIVVIGAPGMVHPHSGQSTAAPDMPGWRPDLPDELERVLGVRVLLENEVNLAAVAEHRLGAAAGHADFVLLWLDEGVGGAVVLDGRLRRGASGGAGELGWLEVDGAEFCDTIAPEVRATIAPEELAERIAKGAFAAISVLDPGLVVLGGSAGRAAGEPLAALVAARLATKSPIETEVRASTVEGDAVLHGAVLTGLDLAREEVFGG
ncbi:ROK family transcriptional regulator [Catenulispora sp. NL8]|uniref:ROK family transcriptional regulator n=1 Tax=Catenulispora pinistramenti TaxID=2705254 RepID=A0ABS5KTQ0_9ACTN|nr:ROK family transcriptional regulator [Catenulispora pinistramenti]MBS2549408.1 ROK family transcriptional regulator [Catenulispora pinistramenti]